MTIWLSFREDTQFHLDGENKTATITQHYLNNGDSFTLTGIDGSLAEAIDWLSHEGAAQKDLIANTMEKDGYSAAQRLYAMLAQFKRQLLMQYKLMHKGTPVLSLIPTSPEYKYVIPKQLPDACLTLSEHAYMHIVKGQVVLESPMGQARIVVHDRLLLGMFGLLAVPQPWPQIRREYDCMEEIVSLLLGCGMLTAVSPRHAQTTNQAMALKQWEFHDLLFHSRSRAGRILSGVGGTFRHWGEVPPLPTVKPPMSDVVIPLHRPDIERLKESDISFTCVMESRRSYSAYSNTPISARELGEFLYRVARVKEIVSAPQTKQGHQEQVFLSKRPYPSGGACYPLELYLAVHECDGIPQGYYHYCPLNHQLELVSENKTLIDQQLQNGKPGHDEQIPQILFTIAARFQRTAWKYEKIAYALILKECGIMTQNMYLVGTSMGLAPCALGLGDTELFAKLTGNNYYEEGCVGELALGSQPADLH